MTVAMRLLMPAVEGGIEAIASIMYWITAVIVMLPASHVSWITLRTGIVRVHCISLVVRVTARLKSRCVVSVSWIKILRVVHCRVINVLSGICSFVAVVTHCEALRAVDAGTVVCTRQRGKELVTRNGDD